MKVKMKENTKETAEAIAIFGSGLVIGTATSVSLGNRATKKYGSSYNIPLPVYFGILVATYAATLFPPVAVAGWLKSRERL